MNKSALGFALALFVVSMGAAYGGEDDDKDCKDGHCHRLRPVCFNVFCSYRKGDDRPDHHEMRCDAAATFTHLVTEDGYETWGNSVQGDNPVFQVSCNDKSLYNGSGHRYTDRLGSRIQGIPGPFPAIVLPQESLKELRHYSESSLEMRDETLHGYCYIYTGPALM